MQAIEKEELAITLLEQRGSRDPYMALQSHLDAGGNVDSCIAACTPKNTGSLVHVPVYESPYGISLSSALEYVESFDYDVQDEIYP
jgi:hypothetical protein